MTYTPFYDPRVPDRIWSKLSVDPVTGCWLWGGYVDPESGYGQVSWQKKTKKIHKVVWEILVGPVEGGLELDHLCRVRHCSNPLHEEPVTKKINILRGVGFAAELARRTHCPQEHEYTVENTGRNATNGTRFCKTCKRTRDRARARDVARNRAQYQERKEYFAARYQARKIKESVQ